MKYKRYRGIPDDRYPFELAAYKRNAYGDPMGNWELTNYKRSGQARFL